ncbi:MAG: alpha/beta fold hydrolase [Alphaproteobacteria bacterium]
MSDGVSFIRRGERGEPILFLHGIGAGAAFWEPQLASFGATDRAIAWNTPGYGGSPPLPELTFPALVTALLGLMDRLELDSAHVVGHSFGGMVAQELVATAPSRVRSLVLSATSPAFGRRDGAWQREFVARRLEPLDAGRTMAELAAEVVHEMVGDDPDPAGVEHFVACMGRVPAASYRAAVEALTTFDRREDLSRISAPTLVIAGEKDTSAPAAVMERMAGGISGARYVCLPGVGHIANLERPAAFDGVVREFLKARSKGG